MPDKLPLQNQSQYPPQRVCSLIIVNSTIQLFFHRVFGTKIFASMLTSDNFIINKYTALQMQQYLNTNFNKLSPNYINDIMNTFDLSPNPDEPMEIYFSKKNNCISLLEDTDEPTIKPKNKRTLLGHLQSIPTLQLAVINHKTHVKAEGPKSWYETRQLCIQ